MSETTQHDYKYPLTRICLREGQMTLTRRLLEIFPAEGDIVLQDSETGDSIQVHMADSRTVTGLGDFYKRYHLNVNDKLLLRQHADMLTITPMRKKRQNDYSSPEAVNHVLDYIADNNTPLSEAEIRDIFPDLPITIDLAVLLKEDGRFLRREGRWRLAPATSPVRETAPIKIDEAVIANPFPFAVEEKKAASEDQTTGNRRPIIKGSEWRKQHHVEVEPASPAIIDGVDARLGIAIEEDETAIQQAAETVHNIDGVSNGGASTEAQTMHESAQYLPSSLHSFSLDADAFSSHTEPDAASYTDASYTAAPSHYNAQDGHADGNTYHPAYEADSYSQQHEEPLTEGEVASEAVTATEIPSALTAESAVQERDEASAEGALEPSTIIFPGDQGLRSLEPEVDDVAQDLSQRVMWVLSQVGYKIEPIHNLGQEGETQQLIAHAPLGDAQSYSVLIHLHPSQARLDWAGLLAKRRETGADYLSVFGDAEDLQRLHSPAELARATLWSWKGLERLESGNQALPLSPIDLEPYFSRHGMFEYGLEHFQKITEQRISERGHLSAVLRRLATLDAPCVFTLSDIQEGSKPPISEQKLLELIHTLSQPPFELVIVLDNGSYSLRQPIPQALSALSEYANSLKAHIARQAANKIPADNLMANIANDEATLNAAQLSA